MKKKQKELFVLILLVFLFFFIGLLFEKYDLYYFVKDFALSLVEVYSKPVDNNKILEEVILNEEDPSNYSLNKYKIQSNSQPLTFLVAGHVSGKYYEVDRYHPALTFMTNIQLFNQMKPDMMVLLGDVTHGSGLSNFETLDNNFFKFINIPVFNAVGNHDIVNRELYNQRYGNTYYSFIFKNHLLIFVDTTIDKYKISSNQIDFISKSIVSTSNLKTIKTIHIFMHHVVFYDGNMVSQKSRLNRNYSEYFNFSGFINNDLIPIIQDIPVYIYAGDVGAWCGNLSPYYEKIINTNITKIATGIGNCDEDSILLVQEINNEIKIKAISLVGKNMLPIETYNSDYWNER